MKLKSLLLTGLLVWSLLVVSMFASGTLTPVGSAQQPVKIRDHQVNVTINNGFAQTEVLQTFVNPNPADLEAVYAFPVPKSASLSEVTIVTGEKTLNGEVLPKKDAKTIYEEEKKSGNDAGLGGAIDSRTLTIMLFVFLAAAALYARKHLGRYSRSERK